jgi:hypothetical protein
MFGFLKDIAGTVGEAVGIVAGIAIAPVAIALGCTEAAVREAIKAGCKTVEEIKEHVKQNPT